VQDDADVRVTLDVERFQEPRAWLDDALIKQIGVSMKTHDEDFSVGDASQFEETSMLVAPHQALMPRDAKFFDKVVSRVLMQSKMEAAIYLGIATPENVEDVEDITVTVERDGKTKTYSLEKESLPSFRRPLSQQGLPPLSDRSFMEAVKEETEDFFSSLNRQLSADWIDLADYEPQ